LFFEKNDETPSPENICRNLLTKLFCCPAIVSGVFDFRFALFRSFRSSKRRSVRESVRSLARVENLAAALPLPLLFRNANELLDRVRMIRDGELPFLDDLQIINRLGLEWLLLQRGAALELVL
jgi:hypothetical protein